MDGLIVMIALLYAIPSWSQAQKNIQFQAANTSIMRDVKTGFHFVKFVKYEFKYLNASPFMSLLVLNNKKCQVSCVKDFQCLSFNVGVFSNSDGQLECELLAKDMFNSSTNMTDNVQYNHYSIQTECHTTSCQNNGKCHPNYKTNTYFCHCPCPYYGDNCQKAPKLSPWSSWSGCSGDEPCHSNASRIRTRNSTFPSPHPTWSANCTRNTTEMEKQFCNKPQDIGCGIPVGVQNRSKIKDSQFSASSFYSNNFKASLGRLHQQPLPGEPNSGHWAARGLNNQYLQIDLGDVMSIIKTATQGGTSLIAMWVSKYSLKYSTDGMAWIIYGSPSKKVFCGNYDMNTVVTNTLKYPMVARYVRFVVEDFNTRPSLRVELYTSC